MFFAGIFILISGLARADADEGSPAWVKMPFIGLAGSAQVIRIDPVKPDQIWIGTSKGLFCFSVNSYASCRGESPPLAGHSVNDILFTGPDFLNMALATDQGIFISKDRGLTWQKEGSGPGRNKALCLLSDGLRLYAGTARGIIFRDSPDGHWQILHGEIDNLPVDRLVRDKNEMYALTPAQLFRIDRLQHRDVRRVFSTMNRGGEVPDGAEEETIDVSGRTTGQLRDVILRPYGRGIQGVVLATGRGIFISRDRGESWERLEEEGLPYEEITSVVMFSAPVAAGDSLKKWSFAAGTSGEGVFFDQDGRWNPDSRGMETRVVLDLAVDRSGRLFAGTDTGVFVKDFHPGLRLQKGKSFSLVGVGTRTGNAADFQKTFARYRHEPSVRQVQHWAVEYGDVSPEKILSWRRQARLRALIPSVSLGVDRSATDLYHWNTGASPDELQKGREYVDWDVSLSWDFSDLVWSTAQTSIDSRSKLNTELREDVIEQVTRLYFERRRLQMECDGAKQKGEVSVFDRLLRIEELTALIDAMTGGQFQAALDRTASEQGGV